VAEKELADRPLDAGEQAFLRGFVEELDQTAAPRDESRLVKLGQALQAAREMKDRKREATLEGDLLSARYGALDARSVAAVHTDGQSGQVLQEATGHLDIGLFLYQEPGGRLVLGAGPVLSYYEFRRPQDRALTGAEWRRQLEGKEAPERPTWVR